VSVADPERLVVVAGRREEHPLGLLDRLESEAHREVRLPDTRWLEDDRVFSVLDELAGRQHLNLSLACATPSQTPGPDDILRALQAASNTAETAVRWPGLADAGIAPSIGSHGDHGDAVADSESDLFKTEVS